MTKRIPCRLIPLALAALLPLAFATVRAQDLPYRLLKVIPIDGDGGWDYLTVDPAMHRLYVSHGETVSVIDTAQDTVIGLMRGFKGVHGIAVVPAFRRAFVSDGRANHVAEVDVDTFATLATFETGQNPDCIIYEPGQQEIYAFNGRSNSVSVIAADVGETVATIPLPGKPEFAACDPAGHRVFDNIEDKDEVAVIDTKTHKLAALWPIAPGKSASGIATDTENHRLFIGCHNKLLVMMDSRSGRVVATVPIGSGVDAVAFDPSSGYAFSSNGEGNVTVAHEDTPERLSVLQILATAPRARTMAFDPVSHKIYLPTASFEPAAAGERPKMVPGSFKVLVYSIATP